MSPRKTDELKRDIIFPASVRGEQFTFHATWGLFSPTEMDAGSRLLLEHMDVKPGDDILDLGCGYGTLGIPLARLAPEGETHLVDTDFVAVEYAEKNARVNRVPNARAYLSNGFSRVPKNQKFDLIVSNLPAKAGRELLWIFLTDAKARLKPGGRIYVVTISGLREFIKKNFMEIFGNYDKVKQGRDYTVARGEI